ncbi:MAG TPA: O-antigen ligase family protein [Lacunisphaera sp.]|nr:O-antigen ligase family protein [Lacunisphaera sp.]
MSPVSHDPFRLPVRILTLGGLAGLAALTLVASGATRMYATPWVLILAATTAVPPLVLLLRLGEPNRLFRFPATSWTWLATATIAVPLLSALFSPYRGPSVLLAAGPIAAVSLFLLLHDWLQADPAWNGRCLGHWLAVAAALATLVSTGGWVMDAVALIREQQFFRSLSEARNPHPLGHSNYTAGLMLLGLPWLVQIARQSRGSLRVAAAGAAALALLNLFTSSSRGGLLGLAVLGVTAIALAGLGWKRFLAVAAGLVAAATLFAVANPRIRALFTPTDPRAAPNASTVQRTAMFEAGARMGLDRSLFGWGPGATPLAYPRYRHALDGGVENALQLHSTPLQLWAETGAAGLLVALLGAGLAAAQWRRSPTAAATLAGYGVFALTDFQLDVPVFAAALATLLALLAAPAATPPPSTRRLNFLLLLLLAGGVIVVAGTRDRTPLLNSAALAAAQNPAGRDRAVAWLNQSLALNPDQEIAHFNLGWLLLVSDPAAAERHFLAAARLVPDKGGVYFGLGLARLNQGRNDAAARAFALECVNDPRFLASPWWTVPAIASQREAARRYYTGMLSAAGQPTSRPGISGWTARQVANLRQLAPRLGEFSPGPEGDYRRERIGYPVLMRNSDIPSPVDLYDVREDPRFPASVPFPLPDKGWLPSPVLLKLLDDPAVVPQ